LVKPWLSRAEESTAASLAPPHTMQAAVQTEQACVAFAKDVRLMKTAVCRVESLLSALPRDKATAQQQLDKEMARFQAVAGTAAARVENMRDLLVRWKEMRVSADQDQLDFQPLTQFLKCYAVYFQQGQ